MRYRNRPAKSKVTLYYNGNLYYQYEPESLFEQFDDQTNPRPFPKEWSPAWHYKVTSPKSYTYRSGWYDVSVENDPGRPGDAWSGVSAAIAENAYVPLEFQENNSFELIPALFDLDGTIAMFTRKFWREISYGSVNWGLLPFISDVRSLINSVRDITENRISDQLRSRAREFKRSVDREVATPGGMGRLQGSLHYAGYVDISLPDLSPEHTALYLLLDELGVHPDLKTLWDVIPLSFVADYFLPVGDYLESVHPRGWYSPTVNFTGGISFKGKFVSPAFFGDQSSPKCTADIFYRQAGSFTGSTRPPVTPEWSAPNARQLFNTAYLARARQRR